MIGRLFRESAIYAVSSVLTRGIALLLIPFYTRVLAPADYGAIEIIAIVGGLVNIVATAEISQGMARYFAASRDERERAGYAATTLWFTIAVYSALFLLAAACSAQIAALILESEARQPVFLVAAASLWASGISMLLQNQLRWRFQAARYAIVSIVTTLASTAVSVLLVLGLDSGVGGVFWGMFAGSVAGGCLALWYCRSDFRGSPDAAKLGQMLSFSLPLAISSVAVVAATFADRVVVKLLLDIHALGIYGIGLRFAAVASFIQIGFQGSLTPLITRHYQEPDSPPQLARIFRFFLSLSLPPALALCIYAREIVTLLAASPFHQAQALIAPLAAAALLSGMYIFVPGLWLARKTGLTMRINLLTVVLNVALTVPLVMAVGLYGAALGAMLSASANFGALTYFSQKHYRIPFDWTRIGLSLLVTALAYCAAGLVQLPAHAALGVKLAILVGATLLIWTALLRRDDLRHLIR